MSIATLLPKWCMQNVPLIIESHYTYVTNTITNMLSTHNLMLCVSGRLIEWSFIKDFHSCWVWESSLQVPQVKGSNCTCRLQLLSIRMLNSNHYIATCNDISSHAPLYTNDSTFLSVALILLSELAWWKWNGYIRQY